MSTVWRAFGLYVLVELCVHALRPAQLPARFVASLLDLGIATAAMVLAWRFTGGKATVLAQTTATIYLLALVDIVRVVVGALTLAVVDATAPGLRELPHDRRALGRLLELDVGWADLAPVILVVLISTLATAWAVGVGWGALRRLNKASRLTSFGALVGFTAVILAARSLIELLVGLA